MGHIHKGLTTTTKKKASKKNKDNHGWKKRESVQSNTKHIVKLAKSIQWHFKIRV